MKAALVYDENLKKYDFGEGHPFRGDRYRNFYSLLNQKLQINNYFDVIKPQPATEKELLLAHTPSYIQRIIEGCKNSSVFDADTPLHPGLEEAARLVVGSSLTASCQVIDGKYKIGIGIGGGLHHARPHREAGFCIYNDVAVAVKNLLENHHLRRVALLDTDVHAGDGTAEIFFNDPRILFIDIHQDPRTLYPGKGFIGEVGQGDGEGFTVNVPLFPGASDNSYRLVLEEIFIPLVEAFKPEIIVRYGGSDAHFADLLASINLTVEGFKMIGERVRETADKVCDGKIIDLLGSGYNPEVLPASWVSQIAGLLKINVKIKEPIPPTRNDMKDFAIEETRKIVNEVKQVHKQYWKGVW
ncbi:histone deacetylase family protein [[Eubacterium] cellulosolvens]